MEKYALLLGYFDKQLVFIHKIYAEIDAVDISSYHERSTFALKIQQFYTALEGLFKQISKAFENHIENMSQFHKEILPRMSLDIPKIRPAVLSSQSCVFLNKIRSFRHFIWHAYDCELAEEQLALIQQKLKGEYSLVEKDLQKFRAYIKKLSE